MASAWIFQKPEDVNRLGESKASWYVGWYEPDGRRRKKAFGAGLKGRNGAERHRFKLEEELTGGTYQGYTQKPWADFLEEYTRRVLDGLAVSTRTQALVSLHHFERLAKPRRVNTLNAKHIADFAAERRKERGRRPGDIVSPASVNKDLRHVKAALAMAVEWGYLARPIKVRMEKAPKKLPRFMEAEHFAAVYQACDVATMPQTQGHVKPEAWWRALLVMAYMTGWRIGDILGMRRDQLELEAGTAISLAGDNKGKRDERVKLHDVVVDHLRGLVGFSPTVFPWPNNERTLYTQFARIQEAAKVSLPCPRQHEHTRYCHVYGFHDLRRAFATVNADRLTADALQALMRHKSYQTTQLYINMAKQMNEAVAKLHVPDVLKKKGGAG